MPTTIIFVVDSSPAVRRMVEQLSVPEGCDVRGFHDGPTALEAAQRTSPHLIIADYHVESMTFTGFCQEISKLEALAETNIISLVSPSDHVDETHLRSLGVTAFLKKPFQPEHLIQAIKDLTAPHTSRTDGAKKKSHSWPPVSQMTDAEGDGCHDDNQTGGKEDEAIAPSPQPKETPVTTTSAPPAATTEPEEAMTRLLNQLLQSMSERTEKKVAELLPQMAGKELAALVAKTVGT
ncbi:MAG: response regulator, partial [Nitrospirae bacterium]|nr:response regulator [Nitrospirota bacterium]